MDSCLVEVWRLTDDEWGRIEPLLPGRKLHPLGCHNPRISDRDAMDGVLHVLRTNCRWNALDDTGICSCSSAYRRFRDWVAAGVFDEMARVPPSDRLRNLDWSWLTPDDKGTGNRSGAGKQRLKRPAGSGGDKENLDDRSIFDHASKECRALT